MLVLLDSMANKKNQGNDRQMRVQSVHNGVLLAFYHQVQIFTVPSMVLGEAQSTTYKHSIKREASVAKSSKTPRL